MAKSLARVPIERLFYFTVVELNLPKTSKAKSPKPKEGDEVYVGGWEAPLFTQFFGIEPQ